MTNEERNPEGGAYSSAMSENGDSAFPTKQGTKEDGMARKGLDDVHEHTNNSKGGEEVERGEGIKTGGVSHGAADEQATRAARSI